MVHQGSLVHANLPADFKCKHSRLPTPCQRSHSVLLAARSGAFSRVPSESMTSGQNSVRAGRADMACGIRVVRVQPPVRDSDHRQAIVSYQMAILRQVGKHFQSAKSLGSSRRHLSGLCGSAASARRLAAGGGRSVWPASPRAPSRSPGNSNSQTRVAVCRLVCRTPLASPHGPTIPVPPHWPEPDGAAIGRCSSASCL